MPRRGPDRVRRWRDLHIHAKIQVRSNADGEMVETTTGRILLREIVPDAKIPYEFINQVMDKKALGELIDQCYRRLGNKATVILPIGCARSAITHATRAGISICVDDMIIPPDKPSASSRRRPPR